MCCVLLDLGPGPECVIVIISCVCVCLIPRPFVSSSKFTTSLQLLVLLLCTVTAATAAPNNDNRLLRSGEQPTRLADADADISSRPAAAADDDDDAYVGRRRDVFAGIGSDRVGFYPDPADPGAGSLDAAFLDLAASRQPAALAASAAAIAALHLEPIPTSPGNYRLNTNRRRTNDGTGMTGVDLAAGGGTEPLSLRPWLTGRLTADTLRHISCLRPASQRCEPLRKEATCFGTRLPYSHTSLDLTDAYDQAEIAERLHQLRALRHVPKCWAVVQPFLCAVFMPKCERLRTPASSSSGGGEQHQLDVVHLPSLEMCRLVQEPCALLLRENTAWTATFFPEFLRCAEAVFPSRCNNALRDVKFNTTGECLRPLVAAERWPTDATVIVDGCGVQCKDPLYTDDEHEQVGV